ncbi:MAG: tRNA pseudouridine(55) synthase TruB [Thermodesulfovibrionales bacterium]|nr:tRNA pseudouridine(55) synthase TruB [Thermodesulfovibrionales bacterium]
MNRIIVLDKPQGLTSQQAVTQVKRALGVRKAGHAGTLDPMATGVLLVCAGEATKVSRFLMDLRKEYLATVRLGRRTDTFDAEGKVVESVEDVVPTRAQVEEALGRFRGEIMQQPPMYSALKRDGTPLYKLARKGIEVERPERPVTIYSLTLEDYRFPLITIRLTCSKGTYVRTLADDLGRALGTVAHLSALRRTAIGAHRVEDAVKLEDLPRSTRGFVEVEEALSHLMVVLLKEPDFQMARHGRPVPAGAYDLADGAESLLLKDHEGAPFALGEVKDGYLKVGRILHLSGESLNQ